MTLRQRVVGSALTLLVFLAISTSALFWVLGPDQGASDQLVIPVRPRGPRGVRGRRRDPDGPPAGERRRVAVPADRPGLGRLRTPVTRCPPGLSTTDRLNGGGLGRARGNSLWLVAVGIDLTAGPPAAERTAAVAAMAPLCVVLHRRPGGRLPPSVLTRAGTGQRSRRDREPDCCAPGRGPSSFCSCCSSSASWGPSSPLLLALSTGRTPIERLQIRWIALGGSMIMVVGIGIAVPTAFGDLNISGGLPASGGRARYARQQRDPALDRDRCDAIPALRDRRRHQPHPRLRLPDRDPGGHVRRAGRAPAAGA